MTVQQTLGNYVEKPNQSRQVRPTLLNPRAISVLNLYTFCIHKPCVEPKTCSKQHLLFTKINHVIYFGEYQLQLAKTNED